MLVMSLVFEYVANDWRDLASDDLPPLDHWHSRVFWTTLITITPMLTTFNMPETQNRQTFYLQYFWSFRMSAKMFTCVY